MPAHAVVYGSFAGQDVTFDNVQDVSGLYGPNPPTISLNSIDFTPTTFEALCSGGCPGTGGAATTADILTMTINANAGKAISTLMISEDGDYSLAAFGLPSDFASVLVTATLFLDITASDGQSINQLNHNVQLTYTPANNFTVFGPAGTETGIWGGDATVDIDQILADNFIPGQATSVTLSLDNTLQAFHSGGGSALIKKKDVDSLVSIDIFTGVVVPEPSTALLVGSGLLGLGWSGRRRS